MKVVLFKRSGHWCADPVCLPGSDYTEFGETAKKAVDNLVRKLRAIQPDGPDGFCIPRMLEDGYPAIEVIAMGEGAQEEIEKTTARKQVSIDELPPSDFSNAMHKIGRPVGMEYRLAPEWEIWLAARRFENRRMRDELAAADELIEMLERELEGD